jgi:hypothetical protein
MLFGMQFITGIYSVRFIVSAMPVPLQKLIQILASIKLFPFDLKKIPVLALQPL